MLTIEPDDIDIPVSGRGHLLRFAQREDSAVQITIFGRKLVFALLRIDPHSGLERACELFVLSVEQDFYILRGFLIFVLRAEALNARSEAAFQVILETWTWELAVDLDLARAKLEGPVDQ